MSDTLTHAPIHTIDATHAPTELPFSLTEVWIAAGGCVAAALLGAGLGLYLLLPFGATG